MRLPGEAQGALAVGWATVELERAATELSHLLAVGSAFSDAPSSTTLGARCRVGPAAAGEGLWIVLLEPDTEGRLAATLARSGEGWVATWVRNPAAAGPAARPPATAARPPALSAARPGPFGDERLVLGGGLTGPYQLVLDAVPSPP